MSKFCSVVFQLSWLCAPLNSLLARLAVVSITRTLHFWLYWVATSVPLIEALTFNLFEFLSHLVGMKPCRAFPISESAILVVGVVDGVGTTLAVGFSELGYTVFALCPRGVSVTRASNVSSQLLYAWHRRKQRFPNLPWGLIAPIVVNTESSDERTHAYETIQAYCFCQSLQLVALIILPPFCAEDCSDQLSANHTDALRQECCTTRDVYLPLSMSTEGVLETVLAREITDPILIMQDYIRMLRRSSGRVIFVSGCSEKTGFSSVLDETRQAIYRTLRTELNPFGIKVASVTSGPVVTRLIHPLAAIELDKRNIYTKLVDYDTQRVLREIVKDKFVARNALRSFAIHEGDIFMVVRRVVESRHPKFNHIVGVHPLILRLPSTVRWLVLRFISEA